MDPTDVASRPMAGEAVALSVGQIILLAGDLFGSFEELTGRDTGDTRARAAVNLMSGIDANEPWAIALLSLRQFPSFDWQIDTLRP